MRYDVIVVGARCAGASVALLLARAGLKVALLDRNQFPSDTVSGHYLHQSAVARLGRWGLREELGALGCPALDRVIFDLDGVVLRGSPLPCDGEPMGYCPRRYRFDAWLLDHAQAAGADLHLGVTVEDLIREGDRVVGIVGRSRSRARSRWHAPLVVGADGLNSAVARLVAAPMLVERPSYTCNYYSYWDGVDISAAELYVRSNPRRFVVAVPTHDGQTIINALWPTSEHAAYRGNVEAAYLESLRVVPQLHDRLRPASREDRLYGRVTNPNYLRRSAGPGWALVGDAGYHKDPITAQGMTDAFCEAERLATHVLRAASSGSSLDAACARYAAERDRSAMPMFDFTCDLAQLLPPPPDTVALTQAMRDQPEAISRFLGVIAGSVAVEDFFAPENLARIVGAVAA